MPPPARQRAAAVAVAALFAAIPLATTAVAYADPTGAPTSLPPESGKEVVFSGNGGLLGVSCEANPSTSVVTVPAETTLRVVNRTGYRAKLLLDGATQGEIADGATAPVVFHRGPVTLGLKPTCMLAGESSVRVEVVAAPRMTAPGGVRPGDSSDRPSGGSRTTREARPVASATAKPDASPTAVPPVTPEPGIAGDDGGDAAAGADTVGGSTGAGAEGVAAEALSSVQPVRNSGPIGLLALIATVCVVGVSAGAIRAIIAQRATRTGVA